MDEKEEKVISREPAPSRTMALVKWTPSFAIRVSRAVYSGAAQVGTGVWRAFTKEEPEVDTSGIHKAASELDIVEELLYEYVENWKGEEPTSPLLLDPDGDFILLPRPTEEVPVGDACPSAASPAPPPHVYIHSALLNALQSVPSYSQNIQSYFKEHLQFSSKSSKKPLKDSEASSSSDATPYTGTSLGDELSSTDRSINDQEGTADQEIRENQSVKKGQKEEVKGQEGEVSKSGDPPRVDVHGDSVQAQVPQPKRSPTRFILTSIGSPLALRRRIPQDEVDTEGGRETPSTEPDENNEQRYNQTEDFNALNSVKKEIVITTPQETSVLQIPIPPSEGQVLIPKPVQKYLNWFPIRSRVSFRKDSESSSDHETLVTDQCDIDSKEEKQTTLSGEEEVTSVFEETEVGLNPVHISEREEVLVSSSSQRYLKWVPIKSPFSSSKTAASKSDKQSSIATLASETVETQESNIQPDQTEEAGDTLNSGESQTIQISVTLAESEDFEPPSQRHFSWIPGRSRLSLKRQPTSYLDTEISKELSTGEVNVEQKSVDSSEETPVSQTAFTKSEGEVAAPPVSQRHFPWIPVRSPSRSIRPSAHVSKTDTSKEIPSAEVDGQEKPIDTSGKTPISQISLDLSEGVNFLSPSSERHLSWNPNRPSFQLSSQSADDTGAEVRKETFTDEINTKVKPVDTSGETQVVQIPVDFSEGEILIPQFAQRHFKWVPVRLPFVSSQSLERDLESRRKGTDSYEIGVKEEPIQTEGPTSPVFPGSADHKNQTLEDDTASHQSYWRPFPVRWLDPDKYRLLLVNTIIRRKEDLQVQILLDDAHFQGSEIVDTDFDELKEIFSTLKSLKSVKTPKAGTWSFLPVLPTLYRRQGKVPPEGNFERQELSRRRSSNLGYIQQESVEPCSPLDDSSSSKNINFGDIHDLFRQFTVLEDHLGVAPGNEMASPKVGNGTTGGSFLRSFKNKMWTRGNGHIEETKENTVVLPSRNEERSSIAPSEISQQRASQLYQPSQDKSKLREEWTDARDDLENFVATETRSFSGSLDFKKPDEPSKPWVPFLSKKCHTCEDSLPFLVLKMWKTQDYQCRRCKRLFCKKCLISNLKGGECLACRQDITKHSEDTSKYHPSRSFTESFKRFRQDFNTYGWDKELHLEQFRFHPTVASVLRQCRRLTDGFEKCLKAKIDPNKAPGGGLLKRGIPDWQKPPTWIEAGTKEVRGCQLCSKERFVDPLHNCRLCGRRVCSQDSTTDFMLYIPDKGTNEYSTKMRAHWKIIRVVGCPNVEPEVQLYLRICFNCKQILVEHQEKKFTLSKDTMLPDYKKCEQTMLEIHQETQKMKENIQRQLPQFVRMADNFSADSKNISESVMKSLVKHQDDLMDQFPRYIIAVDKLREMSPQTVQQVKLVRSLTHEKRRFYGDNVYIFRVAGRQLSEVMPKEEIEHRMLAVNTDAINCACIVISQLAFEVLKICLQSKIPENLAMDIREVSEVCEDDLKNMIEKKWRTDKDETWENHKQKLDEFIKAEMESERRYLKVDVRQQTQDELKNVLKRESYRKIRSTLIQLNAKSASREFIRTKKALEKLQRPTQD